MTKKIFQIFWFLSLLFMSSAVSNAQPQYYTTGTKWTELQLDTLLYDSWYEEIEAEGKVSYKPNFEVVEYYVGEKYQGDLDSHGYLLHGIYARKEGKPDSLVCYLALDTGHEHEGISFTSILKQDILSPTTIYYPHSFNVGDGIKYHSLGVAQLTGWFGPPFAYVKEVGAARFGTSHQHKYMVLDNGICEVENIGVTTWKGKECILGPAEVYRSVADRVSDSEERKKILSEHHHRSMLVRFEHKGEVLYNMWPNAKGELTQGVPQIAGAQKARGLYDLQGRKFTKLPKKGLYIEDGKVKTR
jgi:hypothetical protein